MAQEKGLEKKPEGISFCGQGQTLIFTVPVEHWSIFFFFNFLRKKNKHNTPRKTAAAVIISEIKRTIHSGLTAQGYCKNF